MLFSDYLQDSVRFRAGYIFLSQCPYACRVWAVNLLLGALPVCTWGVLTSGCFFFLNSEMHLHKTGLMLPARWHCLADKRDLNACICCLT